MPQHVLFDADDVIQFTPGGWVAAIEPHVGARVDEFISGLGPIEAPSMIGAGEFLPALGERLVEFGSASTAATLHADAWCRIAVDEASLAVVQSVRRSGLGAHLGTNQGSDRAAYMRSVLKYDDHFDESFYSCEVGFAKPDPQFFVRVAQLLAADPDSILFIDDRADNMESARSVGLGGIHWRREDGHDVLIAALVAHGVLLT
ncbi:HAD-IA family hydrolase [Microbacterium sp. A84]|uniref:HAD-IA family hydrolase n=1 Tax=Microbacterium sp. A84 TaxID=3450715 RepID=UPI003F43CFE6